MERYSLQFQEQMVRSVLQQGEVKFVQLSLQPGQGLTKHRTKHTLNLLVLQGSIDFTVDDEVITLNAMDMLTVEPLQEHALAARESSIVLLVLTPVAGAEESAPQKGGKRVLEHENAFMNPALLEHIVPELRPLVDDHIELCKVLTDIEDKFSIPHTKTLLEQVQKELSSHFVVEEEVVFPRMAKHVGGMDVGPVARLLEEHRKIRSLHKEASEILQLFENKSDQHVGALLKEKVIELAYKLLNHLGKEDSHLFPMAGRLMSADELNEIAKALPEYEDIQA